MSESYVGEIRILPYMRGAPNGWQVCDGSLLSIAEYQTLFMLLGTTYGGDGQVTFAVPDLRSRVPVHQGNGRGLTPRSLGEVAGGETVTLTMQQMGQHAHTMLASHGGGNEREPANAVLAAVAGVANEVFYATSPAPSDGVAFPATMVMAAGSSQPHDNTAPTLTMQYCISLYGIYPAQA